jgi:hypothetical protein
MQCKEYLRRAKTAEKRIKEFIEAQLSISFLYGKIFGGLVFVAIYPKVIL